MNSWFALFAVCLLVLPEDAAAQQISAVEVAERLGLSAVAIERVRNGEVVAESLEPSSDKDLSLAIVMRLDAPFSSVSEFIDADRLTEIQIMTISHSAIDPANISLAEMTLPPDTLAKLADQPDRTFFMSDAEAEQVTAAATEGDPSKVLDAYREVLAERARVYWEKGLAGIAPYAGKGRSPEIDLRHANEATRLLVKSPEFLSELDVAPSKSPGLATHTLSWAVEKGRSEAAPVLIHRILYRAEDREIILGRRFYTGMDYDALQIVIGILPIRADRSALFYMNHTYTSQVAGFGGSVKRSIGRRLLEKELVAEMERAQKAIPGL